MSARKPELTEHQAWLAGAAQAALEASRDDTDPGNCPRHLGMLEIHVQRLLEVIDELTGAGAVSAPEQADDARMVGEVRAVLAAFDWEVDDRQYALEAIERLVLGGAS